MSIQEVVQVQRGKEKEVFTVVAFRYDQANSVLYEKHTVILKVAGAVMRALEDYNADVISIRRVYETCPIPQQVT